MKKIVTRLFTVIYIVIFILSVSSVVMAQERDCMYDTWVATDALGRELPTNEDVGDPREGKYVGIFYFLFMDSKSAHVIDTTKTFLEGGIEAVWEIVPRNGFHVWAEPYYGYYNNTDEWIYRKHAQLLSEAGVDFVFLDTTNLGGLFEHAWLTMFKVWSQIRQEGGTTPQIAFFCGMDEGNMPSHMKSIWKNIYSHDEYKDLWFCWDGKPLLLGNHSQLAAEYRNFFTLRDSWAFNDWTGDGKGKWPWIAEYPQVPGRDEEGNIEQVVVSAGFHSNSSKGRSFHDGAQPSSGWRDFGYGLETSGLGLNFAEQWEHALKIDPDIVMITGWNEFTFGRWPDAGIGQRISNSYTILQGDLQFQSNYVDAFSAEFSRDIEPIKSLFGDNYYYQMASYIRKFKGVREIPQGTGSVTVNINGDLTEFNNVGPVFSDMVNDITHRDYVLVTGQKVVNTTGRNDIQEAKVSKTDQYTYFYVRCTEDIIEAEGTNWMNLYIDADQFYYSGWEGYDFVLNRSRQDGSVSVERFVDNSWEFETVGQADYVLLGDTMVICVDNSLIRLDDRDNFDFKWADNSTVTGQVMEFMDLGDSAPNERFNFRYVKENGRISNEHFVQISSDDPNILNTMHIILISAGAAVAVGATVIVIIMRKRKANKTEVAV